VTAPEKSNPLVPFSLASRGVDPALGRLAAALAYGAL
jgi:hypothetical protein